MTTRDIKVLSTIGMRTVLKAVTPAFEQASGVTVNFVYDSSIALLKRIADGETGDVAVFTSTAIDDLAAEGKVGARTDLALSVVGVAVRAGAPHPDVGTPEKFKQAMLAAKSIARSKTGASGLYFAGLLERLGIADQVAAKMKVEDGVVAKFAARGEVEIAVQQISELMQAQGAEIVGPLPDELQSVTTFSAAVFRDTARAADAGAYVLHLAAKDHAALIRQMGMEPA